MKEKGEKGRREGRRDWRREGGVRPTVLRKFAAKENQGRGSRLV